MTISKREFENLSNRVSRLESQLRVLDDRLKIQEKKMNPQELYRILKTEEKSREIEKQMGVTEKPL
jgi:hypothetical protein